MLETEMVDIDTLIMDPDNANTHNAKNIKAICGSLKKFGQVEPLVVRRQNNIVLGGNGRLEAMEKLGWTKCAVHFVDLDDQKAKALALALNRTSELSEWDMDRLGKQLHELREVDFELGEIGFELGDFGQDDEEPKKKDEKEIDIPPDEFIVVVQCADEEEQREIFEELTERGLVCKVMS